MRIIRCFFLACFGICYSLCAAHATAQHGFALFGEVKYAPNFPHFDYVNPQAPHGGTLKLAHSGGFDSLNPFILKGVAAPGLSYLYESLMVQSLDEPQSFYGLIAGSIDRAADNSAATFTLRKQAKWHDGEPITADDVVFTFNMLREKGHPAYRIQLKPIDRVEKLSPRKIRFHFADPTNRENPIIAASLTVLPKHYYSQTGDNAPHFDKTTLTPPLGSGPYTIAELEAGRHITYARAENYWAKDLPVRRGLYNFDAVRFDVFRDETVSLEALKAEQYDIREEYIARNWATAYDVDAVKEGRIKKDYIPHKVPRGMQAFLFNTRKDKFADPRVREAISLTMDFEWLNATLFYDAYQRSSSFFQNTDFMADTPPTPAELKLLQPFRDALPPEAFERPFAHMPSDGSGHARDKLIRAQTLLNEAGWVMDESGQRRNAQGEPLTLEFMMRQRTFERVVGLMQKNLARLGIDSKFRYVDDAQYQKRVDDRDFDMISIWWNRGVIFPGNEQISYWRSDQANIVGSNNLGGIQNPAVDAMLAKLTSATSLEELSTAARALDRVLQWHYYVIPHWHLAYWRLVYWDKFGQPDVVPPYGLNIDAWWMK